MRSCATTSFGYLATTFSSSGTASGILCCSNASNACWRSGSLRSVSAGFGVAELDDCAHARSPQTPRQIVTIRTPRTNNLDGIADPPLSERSPNHSLQVIVAYNTGPPAVIDSWVGKIEGRGA